MADARVGDDWRKVKRAMPEVGRIALEAVRTDSTFETGGRTRPALRKRDEAAIGADPSDLDADSAQEE